jgi:hypothetical protein
VSEPAPNPDLAEADAVMQSETGHVLGEHAALDRPDACGLRGGYERVEQEASDAAAGRGRVHVDGVLNHSGVDALRPDTGEAATQPSTRLEPVTMPRAQISRTSGQSRSVRRLTATSSGGMVSPGWVQEVCGGLRARMMAAKT